MSALPERDSIFELIFQAAADAQLLMEDDHFIDCNQAAVTMLGYESREALLSLQPHHISPPRQPDGRRSSEKADELIARAHQEGRLRFEWVHRRRDGTDFPVEIVLTAISIPGRRLLHSAWRDISERKEIEKALQRNRRTLEARVAARTGEVQALFAVQQAITSRLDLAAVLQLVADEARRLTAARHGAVYLLDGDQFEVAIFSGSGRDDLVGYRFQAAQSVSGLVVNSKKPFLARDARREPRAYADLVQKIGAGSFLVVPLISGSEAIGVITVTDKETGGLDEHDEWVLTMLASSAVIGLENARMYEEEQRRRRESEQRRRVAEGLRDILTVLNSTRSLDEILNYIVCRTRLLLQADAAVINHLQPGKDYLINQAADGLDAEHRSLKMPLGKGIAGVIAETRKPVIIPDTVAYVRQANQATADLPKPALIERIISRFPAMLGVPIIIGEEFYGGLIFYYKHPRTFSDEIVNLALILGDQTALAVENARLRDRVEAAAAAAERSRLARDLHDAVTQTLFSANLIAEVLPETWAADADEGRQLLAELRQLNRGALAEMRTLLLELRPASVIETRLGDLLRQLGDAVTGRSGIPVQLTMIGRQILPDEVHLAVYRIAQEALNNVVKHAQAGQVVISCTALSELDAGPLDYVELVVQDDGRGFDPARSGGDHLGLNIMAERAAAVGADLVLESRPGQGTQISVTWRPAQGDAA